MTFFGRICCYLQPVAKAKQVASGDQLRWVWEVKQENKDVAISGSWGMPNFFTRLARKSPTYEVNNWALLARFNNTKGFARKVWIAVNMMILGHHDYGNI